MRFINSCNGAPFSLTHRQFLSGGTIVSNLSPISTNPLRYRHEALLAQRP